MAVYVLVEILKRAGFPSKYAGILSLFLSVALGAGSFVILGKPWYEGLISGFWAGASASGVYAGTKSAFTKETVGVNDDPALHPAC